MAGGKCGIRGVGMAGGKCGIRGVGMAGMVSAASEEWGWLSAGFVFRLLDPPPLNPKP